MQVNFEIFYVTNGKKITECNNCITYWHRKMAILPEFFNFKNLFDKIRLILNKNNILLIKFNVYYLANKRIPNHQFQW